MSKKLALILACSVVGSIFSINAHAFPASSAPQEAAASGMTLVRDFCGLGFHRSPYGYCVRNGGPYVYAPAVIPPQPPPVMIAPPPVCPYGYHFGPYGRCYPY